MKYEYFKVEINNHLARVIFDRPQKANSLHLAAWHEMRDIFDGLSQNNDVRVILFEAEGKHWCSGIDIELLMNFQQFDARGDEAERRQALRRFILDLQSCISSIAACEKPVIALIHGACIGGGLDIAAACDIRYCTEDAFFSIKEIEWGMVADLGSLQRLPHILSPGILNEMAYTGRNVSGTESVQIQLTNRCFAERQKMYNHGLEIAEQIISHSPLAIKGTKEVINFSQKHSVEDALLYIANYNAAFLSQKDMMNAFASKMTQKKSYCNCITMAIAIGSRPSGFR